MPNICFVVAFSENRVIGRDNRLLWHLPNDFKHFKQVTLNRTVLMGRKTYESIGRPLPGRQMVVLTRDPQFHSDYAKVIHSPDEIFPLQEDLYVIGGAEIYKLLLKDADIIYATLVKAELAGDALFPELPASEWQELERERHYKDEKHAFDYDFITYKRISSMGRL